MRHRADALRRTAIHEAGHAVIAHAVGARVHRATIKADEDSLGMVHRAAAYRRPLRTQMTIGHASAWSATSRYRLPAHSQCGAHSQAQDGAAVQKATTTRSAQFSTMFTQA